MIFLSYYVSGIVLFYMGIVSFLICVVTLEGGLLDIVIRNEETEALILGQDHLAQKGQGCDQTHRAHLLPCPISVTTILPGSYLKCYSTGHRGPVW